MKMMEGGAHKETFKHGPVFAAAWPSGMHYELPACEPSGGEEMGAGCGCAAAKMPRWHRWEKSEHCKREKSKRCRNAEIVPPVAVPASPAPAPVMPAPASILRQAACKACNARDAFPGKRQLRHSKVKGARAC